MIDIWIDENIDLFTNNNKWLQIVKNAAVEKKDTNKSIQMKHDEYKQKEALKEIIYKHAEKKIDDHRAKLRIKKFELYKKKTLDKRVDFNIKNTYIERQIEQNLGITKPSRFGKNLVATLKTKINNELKNNIQQ